MKVFLLHAVLGLALVSPAALAQSGTPAAWHYFSNAGTDVSRWYFDARSVERSGATLTIWIKYVKRPDTPDSDGSYSTAQRYAYDCAANTSQILASVIYDRDARFMRTLPNPGSVTPIRPGSVAEAIMKTVCSSTFPREPGSGGYEAVAGGDIYAHSAAYWDRQRLRDVDIAPR